MNLNLHIFADELASHKPKSYIKPTIDLNLHGVEIYYGQTDFNARTLYLIEASSMTPDMYKEADMNWLCFGEINEALLGSLRGNLLALPQAEMSSRYITELYRIQKKYASWSEDALTALASRDAINILFKNVVGAVFRNPILLLNPHDRYAVSCGILPDDFDNPEWMSLVKHEPLSIDVRREIADNSKRLPFISKKTHNYTFLTTNIFADSTRAGKIIHCDANQPFTLGYIIADIDFDSPQELADEMFWILLSCKLIVDL